MAGSGHDSMFIKTREPSEEHAQQHTPVFLVQMHREVGPWSHIVLHTHSRVCAHTHTHACTHMHTHMHTCVPHTQVNMTEPIRWLLKHIHG